MTGLSPAPDPAAADDLPALASALVSVPSENPPGDEQQCAAFIADWLRQRDVGAELVGGSDPERQSVGARVGEGSPTLVLNGHTDVVPVETPDAWSRAPYAGTIEDERLYGRGAADMKTGLAVAMCAAVDLAPEIRDGTLPGSVVVHAAMGEETGAPGTHSLLEAGYGGDGAVVLEPTELRAGTSAKGVATYRVTIDGRAAHASHPDRAESALTAAAALVEAVEAYDDSLAGRSDPNKNRLCGRARASVTEFAAGTRGNMAVIPDRAELLVDRRVLPGESPEPIAGEIDDLLADLERTRDVTARRDLVEYYAPASIDPEHPLAARFRGLSADRAGVTDEPWGLEAATDAREFISRGTPAIIWGPGSLDQAHTVDERIDLDGAARCLELLKTGIRKTLLDSV